MVQIVADEPGERMSERAWVEAEAELRQQWPDIVERIGGRPLEPPVCQRVPNLMYGQPVIVGGWPVHGVDGQLMRDRVMGVVYGRAEALREVPE